MVENEFKADNNVLIVSFRHPLADSKGDMGMNIVRQEGQGNVWTSFRARFALQPPELPQYSVVDENGHNHLTLVGRVDILPDGKRLYTHLYVSRQDVSSERANTSEGLSKEALAQMLLHNEFDTLTFDFQEYEGSPAKKQADAFKKDGRIVWREELIRVDLVKVNEIDVEIPIKKLTIERI